MSLLKGLYERRAEFARSLWLLWRIFMPALITRGDGRLCEMDAFQGTSAERTERGSQASMKTGGRT